MDRMQADLSKAELLAIIEKLRAEIEELRRIIEGLQRKQHRPHAPHSKGPPKANPKKPGRKSGNAYGRQGHRMPPSSFDEEYEAPLPSCSPCCKAAIKRTKVEAQFQEEIPRKPIRRKFNVHVGNCTCCGKRVQGRHALQSSDALGAARATLGPDAQAMVVHLNKEAGLSHGKIATTLKTLFGVSLTRGGSAHIMLRGAQRCEGYYKQIHVVVRKSVSAIMDETGWKVGGLLQWLHVAVTETATLYRIEAGRGYAQSALLIGEDFEGFLVHDGWKPYDKFENATHGTCSAHLLRRCNQLLETAKGAAVHFPRQIKAFLQKGLTLRKRSDANQISAHGLAVASGRLQRQFENRVFRYFMDPANLRFANHLWNHREQVFAYLRHPKIDPTSNKAERAIRPAVVNRKVWGGSRTERGAEAQSILMSVLQTCHQRGQDAFNFMARVFRSPKNRQARFPFGPRRE